MWIRRWRERGDDAVLPNLFERRGAEIKMQNGSQTERADEILNTPLRPQESPREPSWEDYRP